MEIFLTLICILLVIYIGYRIMKNQVSFAKVIQMLTPSIVSNGGSINIDESFETIEEYEDCLLMCQMIYNADCEMSITDFSKFEENGLRMVGLQIYYTRPAPYEDYRNDDIILMPNSTLKKVRFKGTDGEGEWIWFPGEDFIDFKKGEDYETSE